MPTRPKYNQAVHRKICDDLRAGHFMKIAAQRSGVAYEQVRKWRNKGARKEGTPAEQDRYRQFWLDTELALADGEADALATWKAVAADGLEEVTRKKRFELQDGHMVLVEVSEQRVTKKDWRASQALLASRHHERWGARHKIEHEGQVATEKHIFIHSGPAPHPQGEEEDDGD